MKSVRGAIARGIALTSLAVPAVLLTGASLDDVGLALAVSFAVFHAWRGK